MAKRTHGGPRKSARGGTGYAKTPDTRKPSETIQLTPAQMQIREFELRKREEEALRDQLRAEIDSDRSWSNPIDALKIRSPKGQSNYEPRSARQYKDAQHATSKALNRTDLSREEQQKLRDDLRRRRLGT